MKFNALGRTGLTVSEVCIGTSPLGGMPLAYGYDVDSRSAQETLREVFASPISFLDTSNEYSGGESEKRIGDAVRERGGLPDGFVMATKLDPAAGAAAFPPERVRQSFDESRARLGLDYIPLLYLHDPSRFEFDDLVTPGGVVEEMVELKKLGLVGSLGVADGDLNILRRIIDTDHFDVVLNHNRYTLVNRSAADVMDQAAAAGVAFVNAAPFGSGILAKGPAGHPRYAYTPVDESVRNTILAMQAACAAHDVELATAAVQFSTRDPRVASTVVGISKPGRTAQLIHHAETKVPEELWSELEAIYEQASQ